MGAFAVRKPRLSQKLLKSLENVTLIFDLFLNFLSFKKNLVQIGQLEAEL